MPQIWLTYEELGGFLSCDATTARDACMALALPRRRCSDGLTRAKLHEPMTCDYLAVWHAAQNSGSAAPEPAPGVRALRAMANAMRGPERVVVPVGGETRRHG